MKKVGYREGRAWVTISHHVRSGARAGIQVLWLQVRRCFSTLSTACPAPPPGETAVSDKSWPAWASNSSLPLGAARPDSRIINWYHGLCLTYGKDSKSSNKHYNATGPARLSRKLFVLESEHLRAGLRGHGTGWGAVCLLLPSEVAADMVFLWKMVARFFHGE